MAEPVDEVLPVDPFAGIAGVVLKLIAVEDIEPDPENPNRMELAEFNELVAGVKRDGFLGSILVVPIVEIPGRYRISDGEHRWKAAKLAGLDKIPCAVKSGWSDDERQIHMVRMNELRGRLDPERFTALWSRLRETYGEEALKRRLGLLGKEGEFKRLLKTVGNQLPAQLKADFAKRGDKIRRVEDLATVVQSLFARYGSTVDAHFIVFAFGGRTHLMVRADDKSFGPIEQLAARCAEQGVRLDEALAVKASCACVECSLEGLPSTKEPEETRGDRAAD
jgi:hypothetical protein